MPTTDKLTDKILPFDINKDDFWDLENAKMLYKELTLIDRFVPVSRRRIEAILLLSARKGKMVISNLLDALITTKLIIENNGELQSTEDFKEFIKQLKIKIEVEINKKPIRDVVSL